MLAARLAPLLVLLCFGAAAAAAADDRPPPPKLEPLPEIAPDPELEPQVTIIRREDNVFEEVRIRGELKFVKVTPRHGRPYYLIPDGNGQSFIRRDSLDPGLKVPMWVIFSF